MIVKPGQGIALFGELGELAAKLIGRIPGLKKLGLTPTKAAIGFGAVASYQAATKSVKGHKLGNTVGMIAGSLVGFATTPLGFVASGVADFATTSAVSSAINSIADVGSNLRLHQGGDYQDTQVAYTLRQRSAMELSKSLLNARSYLGQEGQLMHS